MPSTLAELAGVCGARVAGDASCQITRVNTLDSAQAGEISFLANHRYRKQLPQTNASAVILSQDNVAQCPTNALIAKDPYLAYAKVARYLYPETTPQGAIHERACIGDGCDISKTVTIAANVSIGNNVIIGNDTYIGPGCVIQDDVTLGDKCALLANVTLCHNVQLDNEVILHPGVVIGSDGFGLARENGRWLTIPQIGSVRIMDRVEVGANSTVDRGAIDNTVIKTGAKIDNQVQIGHNVIIGEDTAIAACTGIAGSCRIGARCMIGGAVGISGHIEIADDVTITAMSGVANSITTAGVYSSGLPVMENRIWRRNIIRFKRLDETIKKFMYRLKIS